MFDFSGIFHRSSPIPASAAVWSAPEHPVDYLVTKDGRPFALLNATPALAEHTLAGFVRGTPDAVWSYERR